MRELALTHTGSRSGLIVDPIDIHRALRQKKIEVSALTDNVQKMEDPLNPGGQPIDLEWFRFAAKEYHISPDIRDYLFVPVIIAPANLPNRNNMGFALEDLVKFSPDNGMQYYKTWTGKPTFYEHQHDDITQANGVILDVHLRKASNADYWKIINYMAFDRGKYSELISRVARKDVTTYSMGAYITGGYTCSICERKVGSCGHLSLKNPTDMKLFDGAPGEDPSVAFRVGRLPVGFETSIVETPAFSIADSDGVGYL